MKYTSPIYMNEMVETRDIMVISPVSIKYTNKVVGKDEYNQDIVEQATEVTVDVGGLF